MYNANAVADESAEARYTAVEPPTLCDCGNVAEHGKVYCSECLKNMEAALNLAVDYLKRYNAVSEDEAIDQLVYMMEK